MPTVNPLAVEEGVRPSIAMLLGWFVVHVVVWIGLVALLAGDDGVDYGDIGTAGTPWVRQFIVPLLVVLVLQVVGVWRLGWWRSVLREPAVTTRRSAWVPPVLIALAAAAVLANEGFSADASAGYLVGCAVTLLLVGITEEITFRGVLLVGARRRLVREWHAVAFATVLFGLFHTPNIVIGAEVGPALQQTVITAVIGLGFVALRRASGSLLACIALHAVYDFVLIQANWDAVPGL